MDSSNQLKSHAKQMHKKIDEHKEEHAINCSKCGLKANASDEMKAHNCATC